MIAIKENIEKSIKSYENFGEEMSDGRLTEPSNGRIYRLREAIMESKRLGRPLTASEMESFVV